MSKTNNGGPAFPVLNDGHHMLANMDAGQRLAEGMSLRDYYAGQALAGIASQYHEHWAPDRVGPVCYQLADALLAERAK